MSITQRVLHETLDTIGKARRECNDNSIGKGATDNARVRATWSKKGSKETGRKRPSGRGTG